MTPHFVKMGTQAYISEPLLWVESFENKNAFSPQHKRKQAVNTLKQYEKDPYIIFHILYLHKLDQIKVTEPTNCEILQNSNKSEK